MSGLEAIGVSSELVRVIKDFYDYCKDLQHVPDEVKQIRTETGEVIKCINGLDFLDSATEDVKNIVKSIELAEAAERCGKACKSLQDDLKRWTEKGGNTLFERVRVTSHKATIARCTAEIAAAKHTMNLGAILSKKEATNEAEQMAQIETLTAQIASLAIEAQRHRDTAEQARAELKAQYEVDDSAETKVALEEVTKEKDVHEKMLKNCGVAAKEVQQFGSSHVDTGHVAAILNGLNEIGVSDDALGKIKESRVKTGNVVAVANGTNRIGVYKASGQNREPQKGSSGGLGAEHVPSSDWVDKLRASSAGK